MWYTSVVPTFEKAELRAALVQATVEAGYLVAQAVLYVCVLYFMAGFDRTAGALAASAPQSIHCCALLLSLPIRSSWHMHQCYALIFCLCPSVLVPSSF